MRNPVPVVGRGSLRLPLGFGRYFTVFGGRFRDAPHWTTNACLLQYDDLRYETRGMSRPPRVDYHLPMRDFSVPALADAQRFVDRLVCSISQGAPVYMGCAGGKGRTGLVLACLAKTFGVSDPIDYVRLHYAAEAVETAAQERFVADFQPWALTREVLANARKLYRWRWFQNLTDFRGH